jgi:hypothetical protein
MEKQKEQNRVNKVWLKFTSTAKESSFYLNLKLKSFKKYSKKCVKYPQKTFCSQKL